MSKNIVICLDGTWNKPDLDESDVAVSKETNVRNLYEICVNDGRRGQIARYDQGVGTDGWYDKKIGGIHGWGLSKNIIQAYSYLADSYEEGDKVFLFGFSRGAYTARSLSGLLYCCGLLPGNPGSTSSQIRELYNAYKDKNERQMQTYKSLNISCPIALLGVWDTVGALGIPINFFKNVSDHIFSFHNTKLSPEVKFACHAIAIDEQRESFEPTLWEEMEENKQKVKQVWFAGVHADVGGGYAERHHSNVAFKWMLEQAIACGLKIEDNHNYLFDSDLSQDIHDSYKFYFGKRKPRDAIITDGNFPKIHWSVLKKLLVKPDYQPLALKKHVKDITTLAPYEIEGENIS